jgi:hypothetical protein
MFLRVLTPNEIANLANTSRLVEYCPDNYHVDLYFGLCFSDTCRFIIFFFKGFFSTRKI